MQTPLIFRCAILGHKCLCICHFFWLAIAQPRAAVLEVRRLCGRGDIERQSEEVRGWYDPRLLQLIIHVYLRIHSLCSVGWCGPRLLQLIIHMYLRMHYIKEAWLHSYLFSRLVRPTTLAVYHSCALENYITLEKLGCIHVQPAGY